MREPGRSRRYAASRPRGRVGDEDRELQLLQEFARCGSVATLAAAIAARLGSAERPETLIADAGLDGRGRNR